MERPPYRKPTRNNPNRKMSQGKPYNNNPRNGPRNGPRNDNRNGPRNSQYGFLKPGMTFYVLGISTEDKAIDIQTDNGEFIRMIPTVASALLVPDLKLVELYLNPHSDVDPESKIVHDRASVIRKQKRFINYSDLNANEQVLLASVLEKYIESNPDPFLAVINKAPPLSLNKHSLELFPGVGKKTMQTLIQEIHKKPFDSLEDLRARGSLTTATIAQRIIEELSSTEEKHFLLVKWKVRQRSMKKTTNLMKQTQSKNDPFRRVGGYPR